VHSYLVPRPQIKIFVPVQLPAGGVVDVVVVIGTVVVVCPSIVVVVVVSETSGFLIKKSIPMNRTSKTRRIVTDC